MKRALKSSIAEASGSRNVYRPYAAAMRSIGS